GAGDAGDRAGHGLPAVGRHMYHVVGVPLGHQRRPVRQEGQPPRHVGVVGDRRDPADGIPATPGGRRGRAARRRGVPGGVGSGDRERVGGRRGETVHGRRGRRGGRGGDLGGTAVNGVADHADVVGGRIPGERRAVGGDRGGAQ